MGSELSIPTLLLIEIIKFDRPIHFLQVRECSKTIKKMIDQCMSFLIPRLTWKHSIFSIWDKKWSDKITKLIWDKNIPLLDLPNGLQSLIFCEIFNHPIQHLPNITYLRLGKKFNQPLYLPDSLKVVIFGHNFNQPLCLPDKMEVVVFGEFFNQPVKNLPDTLRELMFGYYFNQSLCIMSL